MGRIFMDVEKHYTVRCAKAWAEVYMWLTSDGELGMIHIA